MCKHKIRFNALNIHILQMQVQEMLSKILLQLDIQNITKQRKEQKTKSK